MIIDFGSRMVRLRVADAEAREDARILSVRKARREKLLEKARKNPKPPCFIVTWFRGRRAIVSM